jgi:DNA-binding MarR family transcriptional regulator
MTAQRRPRPNGEPASKQKLRLWVRLLRATRTIELRVRERLRLEFATTLPKFDVMAALERRPAGMTMTELSRYLMVSNGNVTGIIDRLVAEGMVARLPDEKDRRATLVRLTAKGARHFDAMAAAHEAWIGEILSEFDSRQTESLIAMLDALNPGSCHEDVKTKGKTQFAGD